MYGSHSVSHTTDRKNDGAAELSTFTTGGTRCLCAEIAFRISTRIQKSHSGCLKQAKLFRACCAKALLPKATRICRSIAMKGATAIGGNSAGIGRSSRHDVRSEGVKDIDLGAVLPIPGFKVSKLTTFSPKRNNWSLYRTMTCIRPDPQVQSRFCKAIWMHDGP